MIDWLTLRLANEHIPEATRSKLSEGQSIVMQIEPDGSITWMRPCRDTVRSDSHQITVELVGDLTIYGSPARVGLKRIDNVFGSGDPVECANRMIKFVCDVKGVELPDCRLWKCTRVDVTHNYDLGSLTNVKTALELLRHVEGGRYQVKSYAESVYWSMRSTYRAGKAYSKGEHMRFLARKGKAFLDLDELQLVERLLRLELKLARHFWSKQAVKPWHEYTEKELNDEHSRYFKYLIGDVQVTEMSDIHEMMERAALSLGYKARQGQQAALSWSVICHQGFQYWRDKCARSTYYRHLKIMQAAGLSYGDFQARNVIGLRQKRIVIGRPVENWAELKKAA